LAGVGEAAVRQGCHSTLRPFLTATPTEPVSRKFAIYHASLQELLTGVPPRPEVSDQEWLWSETLRAATVHAHSRIADHYLTAFGGLGSGLSRLAADPGLVRADDGYPLRHLARHLVGAGRTSDLRRLHSASTYWRHSTVRARVGRVELAPTVARRVGRVRGWS
jgi:hypothetical protein